MIPSINANAAAKISPSFEEDITADSAANYSAATAQIFI
jgi:hypothetical protein